MSSRMNSSSSAAHGPKTKRVVIVGGGIAGLSLAVALKRLNSQARRTGVVFEVLVVDGAPSAAIAEDGDHLLLWRWAVEALVADLKIGKGLSRVGGPILACSALDPLDLETPLSVFPPPQSRLSPTTSGEPPSTLPPLVSVRKCDLVRMLMLALADDTEASASATGDEYLPHPANNGGLIDAVPGDDVHADLAEGRWFDRQSFASLMGSSFAPQERIKLYYVHPGTGKVTVEFRSGRTEVCDLLVGADGANSTVRKLMYLNITKRVPNPSAGATSPSTQTPASSHPRPVEFSGAAVFSGITRLHVPPTDAPDTLEGSNTPIEDLLRSDVHAFVPDGRSVTVHGHKGVWFGCTNLGNHLLGWRLVVPQDEKGAIVTAYTAAKNRELMNAAIKSNPKSGLNIMSMAPNVLDQGIQKNLGKLSTDETSAEDKWNSPSSANVRKPGKLRMADTTPNIDDAAEEYLENDDENAAGEGTSSPLEIDDEEERPKRGRGNRGAGRSMDLSQLQNALKQNPLNLGVQPPRMMSMGELESSRSSSRATFVPSSLFAAPDPLTGQEVRGLALKYAEPENFPHPIYAIIARTDPTLTTIQDTLDLADNPLDTFTFPNPFGQSAPLPPSVHPGRVMLIGDAAHPITMNANGSLGAGLAITDAVYLAKLLAKYLDPRWVDTRDDIDSLLTPDGTLSDGFDSFMHGAMTSGAGTGQGSMDDDDDDDQDPHVKHERTAFERLASEFDADRVGLAASVMKDARAQSGRFNNGVRMVMNNSYVQGLWKFGKGLVSKDDGGVADYVSVMKRGSVKKGLPALS
ncbi:hypothetical protein HDU81_009195 [Chytriomyces hyalinus]|nr:hypothetical protein HDU81_009195 [Chytriomyces hyalinus]